eukprot:3456967-Prymnesium_polylepis.1
MDELLSTALLVLLMCSAPPELRAPDTSLHPRRCTCDRWSSAPSRTSKKRDRFELKNTNTAPTPSLSR